MKKSSLSIPYILFLLIFVAFPLLVILYFSFTNGNGEFSLENAVAFFANRKMIGTFVYSIFIGVATTLVCLVISFPTAYILAKGSYCKKHAFLLFFILPMWINFTLRITALKEILTVIEGNIAFYPTTNTIICMVYDFLPFMILPIFNSISNLEDMHIEAANDLGARPMQTFFRIIVPLSLPGVVSGVTMVLLSAMTNYVVLDMVYNSTYIMGSLIGSFFSAYDWHRGSLVSVILLVFIGIFTVIMNRVERISKITE